MSTLRRGAPTMWSLFLAVVMLGGALGPGYVLSYDMVWVPNLALTPDVWGVGTPLPRAVPSDAVIAVLDSLVPGMVLQKVVLLGSLVGAGSGAAVLMRTRSLGAQLVAASLMIWNPFVVERLVIGHWPVLVGYAVLPWLLVVGGRWQVGDRMPAWLPVLLVVGALSASTGVATTVAALAACARRGSARRTLAVAALSVVANLPWLAAGLLHAADATSVSAGAQVFATSDEGWLPGPLAALTLGGIWNAEVVPGTRLGFLAVVSLVVLGSLALLGWAAQRRTQWEGMEPLVVCWTVGMGLAVLSWAAPAVIGWLASHVPGGGLLRDGSRLLALAAPLTVVLVALGVDWILTRLPDRPTRVLVAGLLGVVPVLLMPDAALGAGGQLDAVSYPRDLATARAVVADAPAGDVVLLPYTSYRAPEWNGSRKVLDPLPRFLGRPSITTDVLYVDGEPLPGEDPRAAEVGAALDLETPGERAAALASLGVSVVVSEEIPGQQTPEVAGRATFTGDGITVLEVAGEVRVTAVPSAWRWVMAVCWTLWLGMLLAGVLSSIRARAKLGGNKLRR